MRVVLFPENSFGTVIGNDIAPQTIQQEFPGFQHRRIIVNDSYFAKGLINFVPQILEDLI